MFGENFQSQSTEAPVSPDELGALHRELGGDPSNTDEREQVRDLATSMHSGYYQEALNKGQSADEAFAYALSKVTEELNELYGSDQARKQAISMHVAGVMEETVKALRLAHSQNLNDPYDGRGSRF